MVAAESVGYVLGGAAVKRMSIAEYARQFGEAKTPWARFSLFVRSLTLRWHLWYWSRKYGV